MIIREEIDLDKPLTSEQQEMLEILKDRPVQPDEDCPELIKEQILQFRRIPELGQEEHRTDASALKHF